MTKLAHDVDALVKHVGCGTVDDMGCCVLCELIRARLRAIAKAESAPSVGQQESEKEQKVTRVDESGSANSPTGSTAPGNQVIP